MSEGHSAIHVSELIKRMKEDCILIYIFTPLSSSALSSFSHGDRVPKPLEQSWQSVLTARPSSHDYVQTQNQKAKCFYSMEDSLLCAQTSLSHKPFPSCPGLILSSVPFLHVVSTQRSAAPLTLGFVVPVSGFPILPHKDALKDAYTQLTHS